MIPNPNNLSGFTLIELLLTVFITGIIVSFAIPSYTNIVKNNTVLTATDGIISAMQLARTEAIKRKTSVTACIVSADPGAGTGEYDCSTADQMNASKTRYAIVFQDSGTVGSYKSSDDELIYKSTVFNEKVQFKVNSTNFYNKYSNYSSDGTSVSSDAAKTTRFLAACEDTLDNNFGRLLILTNTGRVQSKKLTDSDLPSGSPVCS